MIKRVPHNVKVTTLKCFLVDSFNLWKNVYLAEVTDYEGARKIFLDSFGMIPYNDVFINPLA